MWTPYLWGDVSVVVVVVAGCLLRWTVTETRSLLRCLVGWLDGRFVVLLSVRSTKFFLTLRLL